MDGAASVVVFDWEAFASSGVPRSPERDAIMLSRPSPEAVMAAFVPPETPDAAVSRATCGVCLTGGVCLVD